MRWRVDLRLFSVHRRPPMQVAYFHGRWSQRNLPTANHGLSESTLSANAPNGVGVLIGVGIGIRREDLPRVSRGFRDTFARTVLYLVFPQQFSLLHAIRGGRARRARSRRSAGYSLRGAFGTSGRHTAYKRFFRSCPDAGIPRHRIERYLFAAGRASEDDPSAMPACRRHCTPCRSADSYAGCMLS